MSYVDQINEMARMCHTDPVYIMDIRRAIINSGLAELCDFPLPPPRVEGPPPALPEASDITCLQTAVFDNWPQGKPVKGFPSRYGYALEVWTQPASDISVAKGKKPNHVAKSQGAIMDAVNLRRQIKAMRKPRLTPIDPAYLDALDELANAIEESGSYVALINTTVKDGRSGYDRGCYYHAHQFMLVQMDGAKVESATLVLDQDFTAISLAPFDNRDAAGNPHRGNVILQSRHDACGMSTKSWATNEN